MMQRQTLRQATTLSLYLLFVLAVLIPGLALDRGSAPAARAAPDQVMLPPSKDNTLYEDVTGSLSNGAGRHFFVGRTNADLIRRGLIAFDIAGNIPAGSTITSATLTLNMSRTRAGATEVELRRLLSDWGEGTSDASGGEGQGAGATNGDATWLHTSFPDSLWGTAGGDFAATVSASTSVAGTGTYTWGSTAQMVTDVQDWLDNPSTNFGWLLVGDESGNQTAKRFDTHENATESNRPVLVVEFTPPEVSTATNTPTLTPTATRTPTATSTAAVATPTPTPTQEPGICTIAGRVLLQGRFDHSGAKIKVDGAPVVTTMRNGQFTVLDLSPGTYAVEAAMAGYLSARDDSVPCDVDKTTVLPDTSLLGGEANGDAAIDLLDLVTVAGAFKTCEGDTGFAESADITASGCVDIFDLVLVGANFRSASPTGWPTTATGGATSGVTDGPPSQPARTRLDPGELTAVTWWELEVSDVRDLYAVDVTLTFDASAIRPIDADPGRTGVQTVN